MGTSEKFPEQDLKSSLDHLTGEFAQTRFQMDKSSRAAFRVAAELRRTLVMYTAVLSLVTGAYVVAAILPLFVPAASAERSWVLWRQVGGTWDPLSGWPTKEACEAMAPGGRLVELAYRCLPNPVDPRGPKGK
jgi:hypothetical protein